MNELKQLIETGIAGIDTIKTIGTLVGAGMVGYAGMTGIQQVKNYFETSRQERMENRTLEPTQLILGYRMVHGYRVPIIADFKRTPHMLVCGTSQQGKSSMVEFALRNKNCILMNCFPEDYQTLNPLGRTNEMSDNIKLLKFLADELVGNKEPIYLVIDEILEMIVCDKDISKYITRLLATSAHNSIYLICISQSAEKEIVKFKSLFNIRVCFSMKQDSDYKTALGVQPEVTRLRQREFYVNGEDFIQGYTYDT